jgi:hypothetical protein
MSFHGDLVVLIDWFQQQFFSSPRLEKTPVFWRTPAVIGTATCNQDEK